MIGLQSAATMDGVVIDEPDPDDASEHCSNAASA
jgi:hypothetical protein